MKHYLSMLYCPHCKTFHALREKKCPDCGGPLLPSKNKPAA